LVVYCLEQNFCIAKVTTVILPQFTNQNRQNFRIIVCSGQHLFTLFSIKTKDRLKYLRTIQATERQCDVKQAST